MTAPAAKGLNDLLATPQGREFLLANGIHTDSGAFRAALAPAKDQRLAAAKGTGHRPLVHLHQQIYLDQRASVMGKVRALDLLARGGAGEQRIATAFLWIDTDRAASDKLACRFYWPFRGGMRAMKITPPGSERSETRFTRVDPPRTQAAYRRIAGYLGDDRADRSGESTSQQQLARLSSLRSRIVVDGPAMLDDYGLRLTRALFHAQLGIEGTHLVVSDLLAQGLLTSAIQDVLSVLPEFIAGYNARVTDLSGLARKFVGG